MSNTAKAKAILVDHFHSGNYKNMSTDDLVSVRDELADLWIQIDGTDIRAGMTIQEVRDALSDPYIEYDETWLYPSTFDQYYYSIEFDSGLVKETDFVALKIS
ncbi:MAG: hypothetical protein HKN48_10820 [Flavobacteriaceae bacterium]|nr:hypothetical protein [Flavobacteriaceae bacterium]